MLNTPCATVGKEVMVKDAIVPSGSVPDNGVAAPIFIGPVPGALFTTSVVLSKAVGGAGQIFIFIFS